MDLYEKLSGEMRELKTDLADSRRRATLAVQEGADEEVIDSIRCHIQFLEPKIKRLRRKLRRLEPTKQVTPPDDTPLTPAQIQAAVQRILGHGDDADKLF